MSIGIICTPPEIHPSKIYNSVIFSIFTRLHNPHHHRVPGHFTTPNRNLVPPSAVTLLPPPLATAKSHSGPVDVLSLDISYEWTHKYMVICIWGFPENSAGKESTYNAGDLGSIPGLGRSPGRGKDYPLHGPGEFHGPYSPWDHKESDTTERLSLTHPMCIWLLPLSKMSSSFIHDVAGISRFKSQKTT